MRAIKVYCPPGVEPPLYAFIDALDGKLKAKLLWQIFRLRNLPACELKEPHFKHFSLERYAYVDKELAAGKYYIRELEAADGYILDKQYKTVYVEAGKTSTIEWENTAVTGQIQITKYAAESNAITSMRFRQRRERRYTTCCCPLSKNISFPYFGRSDISDRVSSARLQRSITGRRGSRFLSTAWTLCCVNCELEQILCGFRKT